MAMLWNFDFVQIIVSLIIIILSGVLHEYMHGYVAYKMGDPTAYLEGRLTLNPLAHLSLFASIILPVTLFIFSGGKFIFGGAKPVPINHMYFKNPSKGLMISAAVGPLTNIAIAVIFAFLFGLISHKLRMDTLDTFILMQIIVINMILGVFNLIPIPPLDGSRVLRYFLPYKGQEILDRIEPFGFFILMMLVFSGFLNVFMRPIATVVDFIIAIAVNLGQNMFGSHIV